MTNCNCPICFFIPSHIFHEIAKNENEEHKRIAVNSLTASSRLRGKREGILSVLPFVKPPINQDHRVVYSANNTQLLPGRQVFKDGQSPSTDPEVSEAYNSAGITFDFYSQVFGRNSIDNKGMTLVSTVHYDQQYDNAFWDGQQMVYGDGDGQFFLRFTKCLDVIAHELTHGVTQYEAGLTYQGESGALNEHFSDAFASMIKQWYLKQSVDKADWLIGQGLLAPGINGVAIRSMKAPGTAYNDPSLGKDPQPAHMRDYYHGDDDDGGVHINSGIPNHAFYLASVAIGGNSWEKLGKVWYTTLQQLHFDATFSSAANTTISVAKQLFGDGKESAAIANAWKQVGVIY